MNLRRLLFGQPDGRGLRRRDVEVENLRGVLREVQSERGLIVLDRPLTSGKLTTTRYGGKHGYYISLEGDGTPYELFEQGARIAHWMSIGADKHGVYGLGVPVGTNWSVPESNSRVFIPFIHQLRGALLWWYDTHKYGEETPENLEARLAEEVQKLPLAPVENEAVNGANYNVVVPNINGRKSYHTTLYGIPFVKEGAERVWRQLRWEQKTTDARMLDAAQPFDGRNLHSLTTVAIAALYKIAWVEHHEDNSVPSEYSVLLRPTRKLLELDAALRRVRVKTKHGERSLLHNEISLLIGAALRETRQPYYLLQAKHNIAEIKREEIEKIYSD